MGSPQIQTECLEVFEPCRFWLRFKVNTSLTFEALEIQVQGHRGNYEDKEDYRELTLKITKFFSQPNI